MSSPHQGLSKAVSCSQAVACKHYANKHPAIAWAEKGIHPEEVADGSFQYARIGSVGPGGFLNWGLIEMRADQMKRTKNSRKMHMVFNVQSGVVEVRVHENEFTVHRGGIWQVPRGELSPSPTCFVVRFLSCLRHSVISPRAYFAGLLWPEQQTAHRWRRSARLASWYDGGRFMLIPGSSRDRMMHALFAALCKTECNVVPLGWLGAREGDSCCAPHLQDVAPFHAAPVQRTMRAVGMVVVRCSSSAQTVVLYNRTRTRPAPALRDGLRHVGVRFIV
jgi:hypothetical protein